MEKGIIIYYGGKMKLQKEILKQIIESMDENEKQLLIDILFPEKYFILYWKNEDKKIILKGINIFDAFNKSGYTLGAIINYTDYYSGPFNSKEEAEKDIRISAPFSKGSSSETKLREETDNIRITTGGL